MKGVISIKDVAKRAGVSPTTVSRVINKVDYPVSQSAKEAVEKAIKELNYEPNRMARGLIKNRSHIIGVLVHDISDAYFAEIVKGIEKITLEYDYIVNIYNTYRDIKSELRAVNLLRANRADALVFAGGTLLDDEYQAKMKKNIEMLKRQGAIVLGITPHPFGIKNIKIGNVLAAKTITKYLINKGHTRIAYVNGPEILGTTRLRLRGYKEVLSEFGLPLRDNYIMKGNFTFEGGRKAARELMRIKDEITAVIAANDETALGLLWEFNNQGLKVPDDISVVGIGNIPASKYSYPPLTTISLPMYKLGIQIGKYIVNKLENKGMVNEEFEVEISLKERESVKNV